MVIENSYNTKINPEGLQLEEKVVLIRRVAKVVKGGRHLRFNALVVVGDGGGHVGAGMGKADAVPDAVRKGVAIARSNLMKVPIRENTIPHVYVSKFGASTVLVKPAAPGTGIVAGGGVRAVMEMAGITDVVTKAHGSSNPINVVKATLRALANLRDPIEELARRRPDLAEKQRFRSEERRREFAQLQGGVSKPVAEPEPLPSEASDALEIDVKEDELSTVTTMDVLGEPETPDTEVETLFEEDTERDN
jgi:small subunit ribosomal protein S5